MGDFRITIDAVGGHGCARNVPAPGCTPEMAADPSYRSPPIVIKYARCGRLSCPDCFTIEFVERFKEKFGGHAMSAKLEHWPKQMLMQDGTLVDRSTVNGGDPGPIDDLLKGTRDKQFRG